MTYARSHCAVGDAAVGSASFTTTGLFASYAASMAAGSPARGLSSGAVQALDDLRQLRNCDDYEGAPIDPAEVAQAQAQWRAVLQAQAALGQAPHPGNGGRR